MRVLQVVAELGTGGAEAVVLGLTEGMVARGHRVWVASDHGWRVPLVHRMGGADHVRIPLAAPGPPSLAAAAGRLLAWSPGRPVDLVHAHNVRATLAAAPVARLRRAPLLTTVHGLGAEDYPRAVQVLRRLSDLVVAVSAAVADDLGLLYGPRLRQVLLFGSWASGEGSVESAIDLLVVLDDDGFPILPWEEVRAMDDVLWQHTRRTGLTISVLPVGQGELVRAADPTVVRARAEAVRIR